MTRTVGPVLFECRHLTHGVGAIPLGQVFAGDALLARTDPGRQSVDVVVGTISACHGAISLIRIPADADASGTPVG